MKSKALEAPAAGPLCPVCGREAYSSCRRGTLGGDVGTADCYRLGFERLGREVEVHTRLEQINGAVADSYCSRAHRAEAQAERTVETLELVRAWWRTEGYEENFPIDEVETALRSAARLASASEPPKAPQEVLCSTCKERPAVCAVGKGGITGSVQLCRECWALDWEDRSDDGRDDE